MLRLWESPIYKFEEEKYDSKKGKIVKRPFHINVTYSPPRNLDDPGKALIGVFNKITEDLDPNTTKILDVGAGRLRNTLWLLEKGFQVWVVEFEESRDRLSNVKEKWERADSYPNFHKVTFPKEFIKLKEKFDIVILVNVINIMPIPLERFAMLCLCRERVKENGMLLWHQWRAKAIHPEKYTENNAFIDGWIQGSGPNHTFYVEYTREESHEILYSTGFIFDNTMRLRKISANSCYSYIFRPKHEILIANALTIQKMLATKRDSKKVISDVPEVSVLKLYLRELKHIPTGREHAHQYHLIASRIFYEIFRNQLKEPIIEREINEGRGRIDIVHGNKNKEGVFKNAKEMRDIPCPHIIVECKNHANDLTNTEYSQLNDRLTPHRGMLGFLLCRDKKDEKKVLAHCRDRYGHGNNKYIIVLDDKDLIKLGELKLNEETAEAINDFIEEKISEIVD